MEEGTRRPTLFEIEANGFLKQMVRSIIGTLVEIGKGRMKAMEFQRILESKTEERQDLRRRLMGCF